MKNDFYLIPINENTNKKNIFIIELSKSLVNLFEKSDFIKKDSLITVYEDSLPIETIEKTYKYFGIKSFKNNLEIGYLFKEYSKSSFFDPHQMFTSSTVLKISFINLPPYYKIPKTIKLLIDVIDDEVKYYINTRFEDYDTDVILALLNSSGFYVNELFENESGIKMSIIYESGKYIGESVFKY